MATHGPRDLGQELQNIVHSQHEKKRKRRTWVRPKWFGREDGELVGQKTGWRRVQYSEKLFPVFVLTSSLISLMQRKSSEERKMKALTSKQSPPKK